MSVICTVDKSEYWQQLSSNSQHQVTESLTTLPNTATNLFYVRNALSLDELTSLISTEIEVTVVVPPPNVSLQYLLEDDHLKALGKVQKQLEALYSLYKKYRSTMTLVPLSAFCCSCSTDTSSLPWLEKVVDTNKIAESIDSVICHSLFNQNTNMIKAYKKLQSCFSLKDEESIFYPNIDKLKQTLTQSEIDKTELVNENERVVEQNLFLLESLEAKTAEISYQKENYTHEVERQRELNNSMRKEKDVSAQSLKVVRKELESVKTEFAKTAQSSNKEIQLVRDELANYVQTAKKELTALEKTKNREIKQLESKLEQKSQVEQILRAELAELRAIKSSKLWKVSSKVEKLSNAVDKHAAKRKKLSQDMSLLYTSELFDADWYLETYSDVQKDSIDPAEHYLLYGANEGRKPSPYFDGKWYLQANPDVASENTNPLIHYIKFGRDEKRPMSPVMITHKKK